MNAGSISSLDRNRKSLVTYYVNRDGNNENESRGKGRRVWYICMEARHSVCTDEDDDDDDEDDEDLTASNDGEITSLIPIDENPEHNVRITWLCTIERTNVVDSGGNKKANVDVTVEKTSCTTGANITGFCKTSIIDRNETLLPREFGYIAVGEDNNDDYINYVGFNDLNISNNPDDQYFVLFELNIALDEKEALEYQRFTNDLSLLFEESLLTDSVLRVSGREFSVHRAVLAARWPKFYEQFFIESKESVVDVDGIEPEAFEKLLRCIYSNTNPTSLLKEDILCRDLVQTLEPTWLKERNTVVQEEIPPSTTIPVLDLGELWDSDPDDIPEIAFSNRESVTFRSFSYKQIITKENYKQSTSSLEKHVTTVFPGKEDILISATWKISLNEFDIELACKYCLLKLISLNNADSIKVRSKFSIWNCEGLKQYEMEQFTEFVLNWEQKFHLNPETMNKVGKGLLLNHLLDDAELTMCLDVDIQSDNLAGPSNTNSTDDLANLLVDDHFSDIVLCVGDRKFPVHRAILAASSPVFRAMFTSNMKESIAEEISIEDIEPYVMKELLRCVYTNQVPVECGCDMLIAFDRFGLISLLDRCHDSVTITVENALEVFAVAEELNAKRLKMRILKFLANREIRTQGTMTETS